MHAYHTKHSIHQVTILSDLKLACYIYMYTIVLDVYKFPVCIFFCVSTYRVQYHQMPISLTLI